ncbi:MAG: aminopeptidase [Rhodocyclales bacterium]|nr:aminopeptidase [Rhodocyclales bacterium]
MASMPDGPLRPLLLAAALAMSLAGCGNLGYYAQAVGGHFDVMGAARPIDEIVRDPGGDPALHAQLREALAIREFATRELGLPDNGSYRNYADLGRPFVLWNVFAAPEFSLQPRSWCMLMVGCVNYRGYYAREDAERLATELRQEGYDTFVGGVPAYSTLGWFDDPVLNTFLRPGTLEVARTVFHELAHQLIFVRDDTVFNESFATAVENEGLRRWTSGHLAAAQRASFEAQRARKAALVGLLRDYRTRFRVLYETPRTADLQRRAKTDLLAALRADYAALKAGWGGYAGYDRVLGADFNNATLASFALYGELVPAFEHLLQQEQHDMQRFYRRVSELAALDKGARHTALSRLLPAANDTTTEAPGRLVSERTGGSAR